MGNIFGSNKKYIYEANIINGDNILYTTYSTEKSECIKETTNKLLTYYNEQNSEDKIREYEYITERLNENNNVIIGHASNGEQLVVAITIYSSIKLLIQIDYMNGQKSTFVSDNIIESNIDEIDNEIQRQIGDEDIISHINNLDIISNANISKILNIKNREIYVNMQLVKETDK